MYNIYIYITYVYIMCTADSPQYISSYLTQFSTVSSLSIYLSIHPSFCLYVYTYVYTCMCIYIITYIYVYIYNI